MTDDTIVISRIHTHRLRVVNDYLTQSPSTLLGFSVLVGENFLQRARMPESLFSAFPLAKTMSNRL